MHFTGFTINNEVHLVTLCVLHLRQFLVDKLYGHEREFSTKIYLLSNYTFSDSCPEPPPYFPSFHRRIFKFRYC